MPVSPVVREASGTACIDNAREAHHGALGRVEYGAEGVRQKFNAKAQCEQERFAKFKRKTQSVRKKGRREQFHVHAPLDFSKIVVLCPLASVQTRFASELRSGPNNIRNMEQRTRVMFYLCSDVP